MSHFTAQSTKWKRVSRANRCPVCGKSDWCLTTGDDGNPAAVICSRIESDKTIGTKGAGWLHRLRDDDQWRDRPRQRRVRLDDPTANFNWGDGTDFCELATACEATISIPQIEALADKLGVTVSSLERLQVGWWNPHSAYAFPMKDAAGTVRGIRLRSRTGFKWSISGSRQGLFVPLNLGTCDTLLICEGPTDCAALIDLDFDVVGRPNCTGGADLLVDLVCDWKPSNVAIIADADVPGQRGARSLAARLVGYVPGGVRIVTPPVKDAREWVRLLKSSSISWERARLEISEAIDAAPALQLTYGVKAVAR